MATYTWTGSNNDPLPADFADIGGEAESILDGAGNVKRPGAVAHTGRLTTSTSDYVKMVRKPTGASSIDSKSVHLRSTDTRGGYVARFTSSTNINIRKATSAGVGSGIGNYIVPFTASLSDTDYEMEFWLEEDAGTITFYASVDGQACTGTAVTDSTSILTGGNPGWRVSSVSEEDGLMGAFSDTQASAATLSSPTSTSVTQTGATIGATTDDATGTLYAVVTTSATEPSEAQIKAGQDHTGSAAVWDGSDASLSVGANTLSVTGLTAATTYYYYLVQDNGADSNIVSGDFTTAVAAPTLTSPTAVSIGTTTVTPRVTTDTGNGTCYYVITPQAESEPSNTQVEAGTNAADGSPVASGSQVVSTAGVITFSEVTGLTAGTAYRISYAHSGTPS